MESVDTDSSLMKKKPLENGGDASNHTEISEEETANELPVKPLSNGDSGINDEKDGVVDCDENGVHSKDSDVDANSEESADDVGDNNMMDLDKKCNGDEKDVVESKSDVEKDVIESKSDEKDVVESKSDEEKDVVESKSDDEGQKNGVVDDDQGECEESVDDSEQLDGDEDKVDEEDAKSVGDSEKQDEWDDVEKDEGKEDCDESIEAVSEEDTKNDDGDEEMPILVREEKLGERNDSEKENSEDHSQDSKEQSDNSDDTKSNDVKDSSNDDVEIIGESKVIKIDSPSLQTSSSQNVILVTSGLKQNFTSNNSPNSFSSGGMSVSNMSPGYIVNGRGPGTPMSILPQSTHAPPKPKSSLDQIELIRWEIQNRLNTRPKYFKPNPSAELGPLSKFLFDIGSNLIKEAVYHELVKIQSKKNDDNTLSGKEKEDLEKLKDIERDLHGTIGHLKLKLRKKCKVCMFQTESGNVIYHHKQFPHEDGKKLHCAYCIYSTNKPLNFKFHLESEHGVQPRLHDKKAVCECNLCPYENNQEAKLNIHKQRCIKQFRPLFNLHPSCLSGAEINLCLENIFYKPVVPKNLKILQQKHAQQQAALAEARRQQAEVQAIAAQKNASALAVRRQRQIVPTPAPAPQRFTTRQVPQRSQVSNNMSAVRYNSKPQQFQTQAQGRPTVANMLKDRKDTKPLPNVTPPQQNNAPGGFEVCEICGGYVKDRKALRIHFFYAHRIDLPFNLFDRNQPPLYCATCYVRFWTAQGLRKHIDIHVQEKKVPDGFMGEGVHGKCISCGQLVGNIVVHMRVVHNREIHHYINALMCMFCGASFNSRPNVERHITEVHGSIDIATGAIKVKPRIKSNAPSARSTQNQKKSGSGKDSLVKGSVCVLCNLNFGRNVDLTRHCMRMHHTCMKCGMVVIDKASLLKHTCLSSPSGTRDCTMCSETGFHPAYYVKHLRDKHLKKFSIVVARVSVPIIEKWTKRPYPSNAGQNDPVEISDSEEEDVAEVEDAPSPKPVNSEICANDVDPDGSPRKKARIGPASRIGRQQLEKSSPSGSKRKMSVESTPERMSKRRK